MNVCACYTTVWGKAAENAKVPWAQAIPTLSAIPAESNASGRIPSALRKRCKFALSFLTCTFFAYSSLLALQGHWLSSLLLSWCFIYEEARTSFRLSCSFCHSYLLNLFIKYSWGLEGKPVLFFFFYLLCFFTDTKCTKKKKKQINSSKQYFFLWHT